MANSFWRVRWGELDLSKILERLQLITKLNMKRILGETVEYK